VAENVLETKTVRESNFELLRLVCMFFILVLHMNNGGLFKDLGDIGQSIPSTVFESFCIVAVNCFVLISGYFGIKINWKNFVHLYVFCFSYTFCFAVLASLYHNEIHFKRIILSFFTFSHSPYWFVNVYFGLYLLSPILNSLIKNLAKNDFVICLVILTVVNVYLGFYSSNARFNENGYNIMNFIYLYFIGRYINLYSDKRRGVIPLAIYITSSLISVCL
jgi:surface polysaccharide O-acyltransferase-like enzyme